MQLEMDFTQISSFVRNICLRVMPLSFLSSHLLTAIGQFTAMAEREKRNLGE
jgi:hypothetical protein